MRPFDYHRPQTVDEALSAYQDSGQAHYVAGGTTLVDLVKLDVMRPDRVIDVRPLGLDRIEWREDGGLLVEANVRNSDLAWNEWVKQDYPALSEAILSGASPQLRNMATTAGNIMQRTRCPYFRDNYSPCNKREPRSGCAAMEGYNRMHAVLGGSRSCIATHPSDMCVALAIFDAVVRVKGEGDEREIPFGNFHLLPGDLPEQEHALHEGELITAVVLPPPPKGAVSLYLKSRDRESYEFALASVATLLGVEDGKISEARIALGGVATKPWRSVEAERELLGQEPSEKLFEAAARAAMESARGLEHNSFKIPLAMSLVKQALRMAVARIETSDRD